MTKFTANAKKRITRDWHGCFPELGEYKPMWLVKRAGCLVIGIDLERDSSNSSYRPTFHTHVLAKGLHAVTLTLADCLKSRKTQAPDTIAVTFHEENFMDACARMKEQLPMPLTGPLPWSKVQAAYRREIERAHFPVELFEDLVLIAGWWAPTPDTALAYAQSIMDEVGRWPDAIFDRDGSSRAWREKLLQTITNRERFEQLVIGEVEQLRLAAVPEFSIEWDSSLA